jgi:hypothetical protein
MDIAWALSASISVSNAAANRQVTARRDLDMTTTLDTSDPRKFQPGSLNDGSPVVGFSGRTHGRNMAASKIVVDGAPANSAVSCASRFDFSAG